MPFKEKSINNTFRNITLSALSLPKSIMFHKFHTSNENRFCDFYHKLFGILFDNSYFKQVLIDLKYYSGIQFTISLRQIYDSFYYVRLGRKNGVSLLTAQYGENWIVTRSTSENQATGPDLNSQQNCTLWMFIGSQVRSRPQISYIRSIAKDATTSKVSFHQVFIFTRVRLNQKTILECEGWVQNSLHILLVG